MNEELAQQLTVNDAYIPCIDNQSRWLILYGGAGSGKSTFAASKIVMRTVSEPEHIFLCLRKVATTVKTSVFAEIQGAIDNMRASEEFVVNKTDHSYTHLLTGNKIICAGLDDVSKVKSIKGITGMWLEETTEFEENDIDQLNIRIRGEKKNYVQFICSFNPIDEEHFLKRKFIDSKDPSVSFLHTNHKHNHYLTAEDVQQLYKLKERNELYYNVYCLGLWGQTVKTNKFFYAFSRDKHVLKHYEPNPHLPLTISFDFNVEPMTAIVGQQIDDINAVVFDEHQISQGSVEEMCEWMVAKYRKWLFNIYVTGDATGRNREKVKRGNTNAYREIVQAFTLRDEELKVKSVNPENKDARVLCNSVLLHAGFKITENCKSTIDDMIYGSIRNTPSGKIEIIKTEEQGRHFLDNGKYIIDCWWPDFIKNPKKYR